MNFQRIFYNVYALVVLVTILFGSPTTAFAQQNINTSYPTYQGVEGSIRDFLCTPIQGSGGQDLIGCINKVYRFSVAFGAIALVFFIVLAGYYYIVQGSEAGKTNAKTVLKNAFVGIAIILGSYVLLSFINPNLTVLRSIQPPIINAPDLPNCAEIGLGDDCIIATGNSSGGYSGPGNGSIIGIAERELGNKGNGSNGGPNIAKYFQPGGTQGQPWCAYFATWVYGQAGIKTMGNLSGRGGTLTLVNYFRGNNGKRITEGTIRYFSREEIDNGNITLYPGDLALFDRGTEGDPNGHTAIVVGYEPSTKKIATIDGNQGQSDEVKRAVRDINKKCTGGSGTCKLIGVGRIEQ